MRFPFEAPPIRVQIEIADCRQSWSWEHGNVSGLQLPFLVSVGRTPLMLCCKIRTGICRANGIPAVGQPSPPAHTFTDLWPILGYTLRSRNLHHRRYASSLTPPYLPLSFSVCVSPLQTTDQGTYRHSVAVARKCKLICCVVFDLAPPNQEVERAWSLSGAI